MRLFVNWLDQYHEIHFAVMREIYKNPGSTRYEVWEAIYGPVVRDDSAEADLYRLVVHDLSVGRVIRQIRETTEDGRFLRKRPGPARGRRVASTVLETAFEDTKQYALTELGKQFVHYTMNETVTRLTADDDVASGEQPV